MRSAHDAIAALIYAYGERIDAGDFENLAALFADATLRSAGRPEVRRGRGEVLGLYRSAVRLYDGTPRTQHVTTNLIIEVDDTGAAATARSRFTVLQALPALPLQIIAAGRYCDQFARRDEVWRFSDRLICLDLVGDLRFHLQHPPTAT